MSDDKKTIQIEVLRYNPDKDVEPHFQTYDVPYDEDAVVLDALNWIKDNLDGSISYRWSCHMAVCGSCGMMVNGDAKLTCKTFLRDYYPRKVRIEPLKNFPIEKDLVTDLEPFIDRLEKIHPYIVRKTERPLSEGPFVQMPKQLKMFKQLTLCINCMLCYAACPQMGINPDFIGPAALALAHRYNQDSRDQGKKLRQEVTAAHEGVWECSFVSACSDACPKQVDPAAAIQQQKVENSIDWVLDHVLPGRSKS